MNKLMFKGDLSRFFQIEKNLTFPKKKNTVEFYLPYFISTKGAFNRAINQPRKKLPLFIKF